MYGYVECQKLRVICRVSEFDGGSLSVNITGALCMRIVRCVLSMCGYAECHTLRSEEVQNRSMLCVLFMCGCVDDVE